MELDKAILLIGALFILLLVGAYYLLLGGPVGNNKRYEGMAFHVEPVSSSYVPGHRIHCYIGSESLPFGQQGMRITLHTAYAITNTGKQTDYPPASIYLVIGNETADEGPLIYPYSSGQLIYNSSREFGFDSRYFRGEQFDPSKFYRGIVDFDFRLVYCAGCADPAKDGLVIYQENTRGCYRMPCSSRTCAPL